MTTPNVLLVVVDALRADYVAPYDTEADTPAIASLADESTVFARGLSPAPWTLPSVTSLLTGKDPHEHGATSRTFALGDGTPLQRDLSGIGYRCIHVSPTTWIGEWLPQGRGFDVVEEYTGPTHRFFAGGADVRQLSEGVARGREWYTTVLEWAIESGAPLRSLGNVAAFELSEATGDHWLDDRRASERAAATVDAHLTGVDEPFFLFVHLMDPHLPFHVPEEFRSDVRPPGAKTGAEEREYVQALMDDLWKLRQGKRRLSAAERDFLRTRYRDEVRYADGVVGEILDSLGRHGLREDTLVAVTGDHGEHLGEEVNGRTLVDHQASIRLPVLRVPLTVRYPGTFDDERHDDLVQPHYLAEAIRGLAGLEHDPTRSLLPADTDSRRDVAVAEYAGVVRSHPPDRITDVDRLFTPRRTAVYGDWKVDVVGNRRRAASVDWETNAAEPTALENVPTDVRRQLEAELADLQVGSVATASDRNLPEDVERRLDDLGYR